MGQLQEQNGFDGVSEIERAREVVVSSNRGMHGPCGRGGGEEPGSHSRGKGLGGDTRDSEAGTGWRQNCRSCQ